MKEGATAYNGRPLCQRLHASFAEAVTVRATFVDDADRTKTICWDYANSPLQYRDFSNYNEMIAPLIKELTDRGMVVPSEGAKVIFTPRVKDSIPLMLSWK